MKEIVLLMDAKEEGIEEEKKNTESGFGPPDVMKLMLVVNTLSRLQQIKHCGSSFRDRSGLYGVSHIQYIQVYRQTPLMRGMKLRVL